MSENKTIFGEKTRVSGRIEGDEDLTVRGRVEGTINLTKALLVEPEGIVAADVNVQSCVISGVVVGNVSATESVSLQSGARVVGDIAAPRVLIAAGAAFRGRVDMGDIDSDKPQRRSASDARTERTENRSEKGSELARSNAGALSGELRAGARRIQARSSAPSQGVAPRIATTSQGQRLPAPSLRPLPGGKKRLKKR